MSTNYSDEKLEAIFEELGHGVTREDIAVNNTSLLDFELAAGRDWKYEAREESKTEDGLRVVTYTRTQLRPGMPRKDLVIVDLGDGNTASIRA
jgi:hypothetical protein